MITGMDLTILPTAAEQIERIRARSPPGSAVGIAARLGERFVSCTLELSGCDAMFVLDDADVALATRRRASGPRSTVVRRASPFAGRSCSDPYICRFAIF